MRALIAALYGPDAAESVVVTAADLVGFASVTRVSGDAYGAPLVRIDDAGAPDLVGFASVPRVSGDAYGAPLVRIDVGGLTATVFFDELERAGVDFNDNAAVFAYAAESDLFCG